jgi:hypothetical protein
MAPETSRRTGHAPLVVCIASSPLQLSVFRGSSAARREHLIVGNRGVAGDITYDRSILNDASFPADFDRLASGRAVEVFIPNALNLLYFIYASHPAVTKISYLDEGRLTRRFLEGGYRKPAHPAYGSILAAVRLANALPEGPRYYALKAIARSVRTTVIRPYERDTLDFPFRTVERSRKPGILLSHVRVPEAPDWVEFVDIFRGVTRTDELRNRACLFVHPKNLEDLHFMGRLLSALSETPLRQPLLLRPHPLFNRSPKLLDRLTNALADAGVDSETAPLSEEREVTVELYARGVRTFVCGESSVTDTVEAHPERFKGLHVRKI